MFLEKHHQLDFESLYLMVRSIAESAEDYIFVWDIDRNYWEIGKSFVERFPLKSHISYDIFNDWQTICNPDDIPLFIEDIDKFLANKINYHSLEYRIIDKEGKDVWVKCRGEGICNADGRKIAMIGVISDMTKENKFDYKTGLKVKSHFKNMLFTILKSKKEGYAMLLGIDHFKGINDKYGQNIGDEILFKIAKCIQDSIPNKDFLYRLDGDKFGIIFIGVDDNYVRQVYDNIRMSLRNIEIDNHSNLFYTISCGISQFPIDSENYVDIHTYAESALYMAKMNGRNQICFFSKSMIDDAISRISVQELLSRSINNDFKGFKLLFQPQVDIITNKIIGAEALLRWEDEDYGRMMPNEFIPVLEKTLLMIPVGRWVIKESLRQLSKWKQIYPQFQMSANVSFVQLKDDDLNKYIYQYIRDFDVNNEHLTLELTENCWIPDLSYLNKKFSELRDKSIKIAIDDFGTGYSALSYLKEIPVDIIKIDRCFINKMINSEFDYNFVKFIIELAHSINKKVCVEGVETLEELEKLRPLKPDYIQGFYFYKPLPSETFTSILKQNHSL